MKHYRDLLQPITSAVEHMTGGDTIVYLCDCGLLDRRAVEREYARTEIIRLTRSGEGRCRAMETIADDLCCSYEKVRGIIYSK